MKRSRLALSLVLGILAALATVDRWQLGGRGVAADLPITLADRLCPADFADDRQCTEPFQWFGESGNRRDVVHTARANAVTPWRPTAPVERPAAKRCQEPFPDSVKECTAKSVETVPGTVSAPICPAETPTDSADASGGFTCGFELDYVLALARYMISGEPTWAMAQSASREALNTSAATSASATPETANLQAWLCPRGDALDDDTDASDEASEDDDSDEDDASPAVAGPQAASEELVPAADLAFDCTFDSIAPDFNYGTPTLASLDTSAAVVVDESLDTAAIDRASMEAAQAFAVAASDEAALVAADLQSICPAAAARYNCGSPQACDPVIAAELGLAPRSTLEWWGAAVDDRAEVAGRNLSAAYSAGDDYDCGPTNTASAAAPVVGSLANVLADIREQREWDFGMQLNAEVDAIAEWSNSIPAETATPAVARPITTGRQHAPTAAAGDECGFADPVARRADSQAANRLELADAYFGAADLLFAGLNSQQSLTANPADAIDAQRVISGAIRHSADNSAHDDYPGDETDSVLFETLLNGPTRFVYLRRLPPSRWTMPIDWRAESLRVWDGGQGRWPFVAPQTPSTAPAQPLMVRSTANETPGDRAITWPCLSADWTYIAQCDEQDVAVNEQALADAKLLQQNALRLAADCADCLRALAGGIDAFARSLTLGQLDGLRSAALPQRPLPSRDEFRTAPEIDAPVEPSALQETMPEQGSSEPPANQQHWGIYLGL